MKFLLYSQSGEAAQVLKRIELEGNEVCLYINDKAYRSVFDNLIQKTNNPDSFIDKDTIILFDMSGNGEVADSYKKKGLLTFGASLWADKLEHDREFGFEMMRKCGIKIPDYELFTDWNKAGEYVKQSQQRLVFKPNGSMPTKLTYVSKDNKEMSVYLKYVEKVYSKDIESFILQEFIEGVVVSSEFLCNGKEFCWPPNHTVEVKKSANDELGPSTGCAGNIVWICEDSEIIKNGVQKIEQECIKEGYIGNIDLNAVVNEQGVYGLEWTPRFGYDALPALLTLHKGDIGQLFSDLAYGDGKNLQFIDKVAGSIRLSIPPYPVEIQEEDEKKLEEIASSRGLPILNYEKHEESLYFYEVEMSDYGLCHSGGSGNLLLVCGTGSDPKTSLEEPYEILENLIIPDKCYRTDLKKVLPKMAEEVLEYV